MRPKSPLPSRYAAILMGVAAVMHSLVAFDLVLHFFPDTPEFQALWAASTLVKVLWLSFVALGLATAVLLYRAPRAGFALSLVATACLYFASAGLWHEIKGGFWLAVAASVLAALGAWRARSNNSFKPKPLRGSA
jgi:hypothetical protein